MKLYSMIPQDSSGKVRWMLHELEIPFEDIRVSYKKGDTKTPEFLAMNPIGQVPILKDGDLALFESYAIVHYLADKYSEKKLAPAVTNLKERTNYTQWLFFCSNTVEDFFGRFQKLPTMSDDYKKDWGNYIHDKIQKIMTTLSKQLQSQDYILGSFSAVDTCLGYALDSVSEEPFFKDYPVVVSYFNRLQSREACVKSEVFKRD